jgi:hypothetical protein
MAVNKGEIGIYGILVRDGGDNILAKAEQIKDEKYKGTKELQSDINNELYDLIDGTSGSVSD